MAGPRAALTALFRATLAAIDPARAVRAALGELAITSERVVVVAAGKAARAMARGAIDVLGDEPGPGRPGDALRALVVVPDGPEFRPESDAPGGLLDPLVSRPDVTVLAAGHPVPDERSVAAARAVIDLVSGAHGREVVFLVSGGASALLALPAPGLALADKIAAVRAVAGHGAAIAELNTVRKHLSAIKGGQLAALCPAPIVTLVASDVVGDDIASVGSGPTVPDPTTFRAACDIMARAAGWSAVPAAVREHLERGLAGRVVETPKHERPGDRVRLVLSCQALLDAACRVATEAGFSVQVFAPALTGDVGDVARRVAVHAHRLAALRSTEPRCLVAAGEPTITLPARPGRGGRAQHLALEVARDLAGVGGVTVLCAGSDGIDGASDAAGAVIDGSTYAAIARAGIDPDGALARCDSNTALRAVGADLVTGPTGINHADLILLVAAPP